MAREPPESTKPISLGTRTRTRQRKNAGLALLPSRKAKSWDWTTLPMKYLHGIGAEVFIVPQEMLGGTCRIEELPRKLPEASMEWEVTGADRVSGQDRSIIIEADTEDSARRRANRRGLLVADARPLENDDSAAGIPSGPAASSQPTVGEMYYYCATCRNQFPADQLYDMGSNRYVCHSCYAVSTVATTPTTSAPCPSHARKPNRNPLLAIGGIVALAAIIGIWATAERIATATPTEIHAMNIDRIGSPGRKRSSTAHSEATNSANFARAEAIQICQWSFVL